MDAGAARPDGQMTGAAVGAPPWQCGHMPMAVHLPQARAPAEPFGCCRNEQEIDKSMAEMEELEEQLQDSIRCAGCS